MCSATGERGPLHHPEFTMLEWYRTNEPYEALMQDCAAILVGSGEGSRRPANCNGRTAPPIPYAAPERLSVADAFQRYAGIDLLATLDDDAGDRDKLAAAARAAGIQVADDDNWSRRVQPRAGRADRAAARARPAGPARPNIRCRRRRGRSGPTIRALRERFELYACGVELANGFAEITDRGRAAPPLRGARWRRSSDVYGEQYPIDEDFLAALGAMPPASGIALGFDRLVMLATGASRIEQVLWAPVAGDDR